ncbi:response regulator [Fibrella forsythiae]|uniref:Response regulator transcription factor n=1 Tax=Fibrella forsythiae TaxID=2817061 RepID=A0ABS3JDW1_9BACT|nr:response regulator transcription factor [Fibrella forsythiae]MBO0948195.1 response regulator transcription factor [Fibrella forsythiae]
MPTRTILIDDHRLFNDGLSLVLRDSMDFVVVEQVYDSRLALDACLRLAPDLVLVDVNMPHYDGRAVVEQLKQLPTACKIVIISMYAEKKEIVLFNALKINGYIAKTVAAERLLLLLRRVMEGQMVIETDSAPSLAPPAKDTVRFIYGLTKREVEILKLVKRGLTSEQIAADLSLSYYTVQTHRKNITHKLPFTTKKEYYDFLETL